MTIYLLIHEHQFGISHATFQSDRALAGHYEGTGVGNEDYEELIDIAAIGTKLGLDIEFDKPETVDIIVFDLINIPII